MSRQFKKQLKLNLEKNKPRHLYTWWQLSLFCTLLMVGGCDGHPASPHSVNTTQTSSSQLKESKMWMTIGEQRFSITLVNNETAQAFTSLFPLTINMADFNGNEKHAGLPKSLPTNASRPGTIRNGDLMLYGSNTLVLFYLTFHSSYSYTRIGHVDNPEKLTQALGQNNVRITFSQN